MDSWYWWLSLCELLGDLMGFLCLMCCLCCGCRKTICEITSWIYQFKGSTSAGHSPLDFCNLAHCAQPSQLGWRHERTIVPIFFYHHFDENAVQKLLTQCGRCCNCLKTWVCGKNVAKKPHIWQSFGFQVFSFDSFFKKKTCLTWYCLIGDACHLQNYCWYTWLYDVSFSLASDQRNACYVLCERALGKGIWGGISCVVGLNNKKHHSITGQKQSLKYYYFFFLPQGHASISHTLATQHVNVCAYMYSMLPLPFSGNKKWSTNT